MNKFTFVNVKIAKQGPPNTAQYDVYVGNTPALLHYNCKT